MTAPASSAAMAGLIHAVTSTHTAPFDVRPPCGPLMPNSRECQTCGGDGDDLEVSESDASDAQCPDCGAWFIDFCPDCGDEYSEPCPVHVTTIK
jgi:hypothetical protein